MEKINDAYVLRHETKSGFEQEFAAPNIGGRILQIFHDPNSKGRVKYRSFRTV